MIDDLLNMLQGEPMNQMSRRVGADHNSVATAVSASLPLLLGALDKNTNDARGARSLDKALERDHDGSILNDLTGFFSQGSTRDGNAILGHVLGNRKPAVERTVGRMSGMDSNSVEQILAMLAPMVLGMLGKQKRQQGMDADTLSQFLGQKHQEVRQRDQGVAGLISQLLDGDGDGDPTDDIMRLGGSILGGMFDKRR